MLFKKKIQVSTLLAALVVFILPWLDMQCNGTSMMTQSGVQTIYGGASLSAEMEQLANRGDKNKQADKDNPFSDENRPPPAWLAAGGLLLLLLAFAMAVRELLAGATADFDRTVPLLATMALGLLALQMAVGFPMEAAAEQAMQEAADKRGSDNEGIGMLGAAMIRINVDYQPWLYVELVLLAIPGAFWLNDFINRRNQGAAPVPQAPT